jgi:hypothetical protein
MPGEDACTRKYLGRVSAFGSMVTSVSGAASVCEIHTRAMDPRFVEAVSDEANASLKLWPDCLLLTGGRARRTPYAALRTLYVESNSRQAATSRARLLRSSNQSTKYPATWGLVPSTGDSILGTGCERYVNATAPRKMPVHASKRQRWRTYDVRVRTRCRPFTSPDSCR